MCNLCLCIFAVTDDSGGGSGKAQRPVEMVYGVDERLRVVGF